MPGLYVNVGNLWAAALAARDRAVAEGKDNPDAAPLDVLVAIVMAAATTEAFINELAESVGQTAESPYPPKPPAAQCAFADAVDEIEQSKGRLQLKYLVASQLLAGKPIDKGANPYQDFQTLISLRNDLMHLKPSNDVFEMSGETAEDFKVTVTHPKHVRSLQQRGIARKTPEGMQMTWLLAIQTPKVAEWACESAKAIILHVLSFFPDGPAGIDQAWMFKNIFRRGA